MESKNKIKGKFEELKEYILNNAPKLLDGTPIFSARYFAEMIDQAKEEYPYGFSVSVSWRQKDEWFEKWFGKRRNKKSKKNKDKEKEEYVRLEGIIFNA